MEYDLGVTTCCKHFKDAVDGSESDSFKTIRSRVNTNRLFIKVFFPIVFVECMQFTGFESMRQSLIDTNEGSQVFLYSKNALEIQKRVNMDV